MGSRSIARWPIWSAQPHLLPARVSKEAAIDNSLITPGSLIRGQVINSVIGPRVTVEEGASLRNCVVLEGATITAGANLVNAVVDCEATLSAHDRGSEEHISLINPEGVISAREPFDPGERPPSWMKSE